MMDRLLNDICHNLRREKPPKSLHSKLPLGKPIFFDRISEWQNMSICELAAKRYRRATELRNEYTAEQVRDLLRGLPCSDLLDVNESLNVFSAKYRYVDQIEMRRLADTYNPERKVEKDLFRRGSLGLPSDVLDMLL